MSERTLETNLWKLEAEVGDHAGFGSGARFEDTAWTPDMQRRITEAVDSGCRQVYFTEKNEDVPAAYQWSWLQPLVTIEIEADQQQVILPRDCNGILGAVVPAANDGIAQFPIPVVPYQAIYQQRALSPTQTGRPAMCCEQVLRFTTGTRGSRYTLQVFPITDEAYTLQIPMAMSPGPLTAEHPIPHGGAPLAQAFQAAVVAAYAEKWEKGTPQAAVAIGTFQTRLRAAIAADRMHKPLHLGLNSDTSDCYPSGRPVAHGAYAVPFTVNGVTY